MAWRRPAHYDAAMGLLDQFDLRASKQLYRADLPLPVDVLSFIHLKDEEAYRWYGVLTVPLLKAVGAKVGRMGMHVKAFVDRRPCRLRTLVANSRVPT